MAFLINVLNIISIICIKYSAAQVGSSDLLFDALKNNGSNDVPPLIPGSVIDVNIEVSLIDIIDLVETDQEMIAIWKLNMEWNDVRLMWTPADYGNLKKITLPSKDIWVPDLAVMNSEDIIINDMLRTDKFRATVYHNGTVSWNTAAISTTSCEFDMTYFPMDTQECCLVIESWSMESNKLRFVKTSDHVNKDDFLPSQQWNLMATDVRVLNWTGAYSTLNITLTLARKPDFYIVNIVLPTMLLSGLTLLVFLMPAEAKEKTVLVATMLLSLAVFATVVAEEVPKTSTTTPLLSKYVYTVMCLCALAILATIIVLNLHDGSVENPPMWLRHFAYHLSRVLCMGTHGDPSVSVAPESEEVFADKLREHLVESKKTAKNGRGKLTKADSLSSEDAGIDMEELGIRRAGDTPLSGDNRVSTLVKQILADLQMMTKIARKKSHEYHNADEWAFIARAFDRLFFWLFTLSNVFALLILFVVYPSQQPTIVSEE